MSAGVVGSSGSTVTNCYNTGTVKGSAYIVGGVGRRDSLWHR